VTVSLCVRDREVRERGYISRDASMREGACEWLNV
jgi:hypothetical protein